MSTQHSLFPADTDAAPPRERRELTTADIDKVRQIEGFPIATDEAIIALSDPPHYTACPNPFLADFIAEHGTLYDAATDDYQREPFAADVSEGKNDPIYNAHSYHTKVPHKAIMRYILHYTNPGDIVFDGFCGTGMTGVAAQLCGDRAAVESLGYRVEADGNIYDPTSTASPLSASAAALSVASSPPLLSQRERGPGGEGRPFSRLGARKAVLSDLSPAATFIAYNYNTPVDVAAFEREARRILAEVEAECGWMYETTHTDGRKGRINYTVWSEVFNCHNCSQEIVFLEGALDQESGEVSRAFNCPHCGVEVSKRSMTRAFESFYDLLNGLSCQRVKRVPVLINYTYKGKRYEKKADISDIELVKKIDQTSIQNFFPTIEMPFMHVTHIKDKMSNFGISHFSHFFLNRPQHALSTAWYAANKSQHLRTKQAMLFLIEQCFWTMTILNRYRPTGYSQTNQYMSGVYFVPSQSSEISPWYILDGKLQRLIKLFKILPVKDNRVAVSLNSGGEIPLPESTVDYIFTDPPFGENLQYSELNWFIESFYQVLPNTSSEAVVNKAQKKDTQRYMELMFTCFKENYRILKPGRWMTVEFHNSQNAIWNAIQEAVVRAGFVVADVRTLDKQGETYKQSKQGLVKADLVISAYKPRTGFEQAFERVKGTEDGAWQFVREHLTNVPVFVESKGKAEVIAERMPYLLFDRMVAFHLQRGATVPLSAAEFYAGLRQRFPERDGMHFLETQAAEYDQKRSAVGDIEQFTFYVSDEKSSLQWLRQLLSGDPQTYQQIQPRFLQELQQNRTEMLPELRDLLEQNFLQDEQGRWYIPDPSKQVDLEKLRRRELLREYATYTGGRGKLKSVRSEAVRAGFEEAYRAREYAAILAVAARLPEAVLREDSTILTYYDLAQMEVEG